MYTNNKNLNNIDMKSVSQLTFYIFVDILECLHMSCLSLFDKT